MKSHTQKITRRAVAAEVLFLTGNDLRIAHQRRSKVAGKSSLFAWVVVLFVLMAGTVPAMAQYTISTIAGSGLSFGFGGDGGTASGAAFNQMTGICSDASGNVYVADQNNNEIRKISTSGVITNFAGHNGVNGYSGDGGAASSATLNEPIGVACDAFGNVYIADQNNNVIRKVNASGIISTFAGTGATGFSGDGGPAASATFNGICAIAVDNAGNVYIADVDNGRIRKVNTSGIISTVAGGGTNTSASGVAASTMNFNFVRGLALDAAGNIFIAEYNPGVIQEVTTSGICNIIAGSYYNTGYSGDGGPATSAQFNYPVGICVDAAGNLFIMDQLNNRVRMINTSGNISTVAGNGTAGFSGDGGAATSAEINGGLGIGTGPGGEVLIADTYNNRVRLLTPPVALTISGITSVCQGATTTLTGSVSGGVWSSNNTVVATIGTSSGTITGVAAGTAIISYVASSGSATAIVTVIATPSAGGVVNTVAGGGSTVGDGGPATSALIGSYYGYIQAITTDATGNLYIGDDNGRVRKVDVSTGIITTICGNGTFSSTGDGGPATAATVGLVNGLAFDAAGNLYIADATSNNIRMINTSGIISTFAGTGAAGYGGDGGAATSAVLNYPCGIAFDASGNLVFADFFNARIRKITPAGTITTIAGNGTVGHSGDGGAATSAHLAQPKYVAIDASGNIFFTDPNLSANNNYFIREINTSGIISAVAGTGGPGYGGDGGLATGATFNGVSGLAFDASGNLVIADAANGRIRQINTSGIINTIYGTGSITNSGDGGPATAAGLQPYALAFDPSGNLYFTNQGGTIREIGGSAALHSIAGNTAVCSGSTTSLTDGSAGGSWSSGNTAVATISSTGVVTGVAGGTAVISYTIWNPCLTESATVIVTVNASGLTAGAGVGICPGSSATLVASGGTTYSWAPSFGLTVTTGASVIATPTVTTTYTVTSSIGGCIATATKNVSVNTTVAGALTGLSGVIVGSTITLSDAITGGAWSSSHTAVATVADGVVTGIAAGTATISYIVTGSCGTATATKIVTVTPNPVAVITGTAMLCLGGTTALTDITTGGAWSSSNTSVATIGTSGIVTASATTAGTTTISYTTAGGANTRVVSVNPTPNAGPVTGAATLCALTTTTLTDATGGGAWTSTNTAVATVSGGVVTGVAAGTTTISYTITSACGTSAATQIMTINAATNAGIITGPTSLFTGTSIDLADAITGGTWSAGNGNVSISGGLVVTGLSAGTVVISYSVFGATCGTAVATKIITVNTSTVPGINGNTGVCKGATTTLTDATGGGTWSSSNALVATVGATTGVVTGATLGTAYITYTNAGAYITTIVTVNPMPGGISGATAECIGATITLSNSTTGGLWTNGGSSNTNIDEGSGTLMGLSAGTSIITYTLPTGCAATLSNLVNPNPSPILGNFAVCVGTVTNLSDATTGSISYTSSNTLQATVTITGVVTGVAAGNPIITYKLTTTGCVATQVITVNALPGSINGNTVCAGGTAVLTDPAGTGLWTSSNTTIVSVGSSTGIATGVTAGVATITYVAATGCKATGTITVNPLLAIMGATSMYAGTTITLSDATAGGTWSSGNPAAGSVSATGVVTGIAAGSLPVTYALTSGCSRTTTINVIGATPITGTPKVCIGSTTALTDATAGGTWSSSNTLVASVGTSGIVTASATTTGTTTISYTTAGGTTTQVVTVNPKPAGISGLATECAGNTITLSDATTGGAWSNGGSAVTTVDGSGNVHGVSAGSCIITYTLPTGCAATLSNVVNPSPTPILGTFAVCVGATTNLTDATTGSISYTSSNTLQATVSATGVVTGVAAGSPTITYKLTATGCLVTQVVTVNSLPGAITGTAVVCSGTSTTMSDPAGAGTWSSSNTAIATAGTVIGNGTINGIAGGTATITYIAATGCKSTRIVTVNTIPAISGALIACLGTTTHLTDATTGGIWSSSNPSVGSIGSSTGIVTGIGLGALPVVYTIAASGCTRTATVNIGSMTPITGSSLLCRPYTTALTDVTTGGTWSSSNTLVATVGTGGLVAASNSVGTVTITYTISGCVAAHVMTVNAGPSGIAGVSSECVGTTITLSDATTGGSWSNNSSPYTTIGSTGIVAGISAGSSTITYTMPNGCSVTYPNVVNPNPATLLGNFVVCAGSATDLSDATTGSISYTSSNTLQATATNSGVVTGVSAGNPTITYKLTLTGCFTTHMITVNPVPAVTAISGVASISHSGGAVTLSDATTGGLWTSSAPTVISLSGTTSPVVTAMALSTSGASVISYAVTNTFGCKTTATKNISATTRYISTTGNTTTVSAGSAVNIADETNTGAWSSSDDGIATVDNYGTVTGIKAGTVNITHETTNSEGDITTNATQVVITALPVAIQLIPNPNNGMFTVKGTLGIMQDEEVTLEVTNVLGQVIYTNKVMATSGHINEKISLGNTLANGMYLLNIRSASDNSVFHFVIGQ